jgi:hypothetical protein
MSRRSACAETLDEIYESSYESFLDDSDLQWRVKVNRTIERWVIAF